MHVAQPPSESSCMAAPVDPSPMHAVHTCYLSFSSDAFHHMAKQLPQLFR